MTNLNSTRPFQQLTSLINDRKYYLAILSHPTIKRLALKYPEADFNQWYTGVTFSIYLNGDGSNPLYDISTYPNVQAGSDGYELEIELYRKTLKTRSGRTFRATVTIYASQPFTKEEKDLLVSIGKIQTITETKTYQALMCEE